MTLKKTSHYNLTFFDCFVVVEANAGAVVTQKVVNENLQLIFDHFNGKEFTLISHRKNDYVLDLDIYSLKLTKKLRGIAVVSSDSTMKEKAALEQLAFDSSFAYFENLDDAKRWAGSMVKSKV